MSSRGRIENSPVTKGAGRTAASVIVLRRYVKVQCMAQKGAIEATDAPWLSSSPDRPPYIIQILPMSFQHK